MIKCLTTGKGDNTLVRKNILEQGMRTTERKNDLLKGETPYLGIKGSDKVGEDELAGLEFRTWSSFYPGSSLKGF